MRRFLLLLIIVISFASAPVGVPKAATFNSVESPSNSPAAAQRRRARGHRRACGPVRASSVPVGATARCGDGTYSFSQHRRGTCSHHGGVAAWF